MALSRKDLSPPIRRKSVVEIEGVGEFIVQALSLTDRFTLQMQMNSDKRLTMMDRISWILHRAVIDPDGKPFWTEAEWQDWGSTLDGNLACIKLFTEVESLFVGGEKKESTENSDSPADSPSSLDEPSLN